MTSEITPDQLQVLYVDFFYREYLVRNAWSTVDREKLYYHVKIVSDFIIKNIDIGDVEYTIKVFLDKISTEKYKIKSVKHASNIKIDELYNKLRNAGGASKSLEYILGVSYKHGIYATDILRLHESSLNIKQLTDDSVSAYIRFVFLQQRIRPESVGNSIYSLSPNEMQDVFKCRYNNEDHFLKRYALLIDIDRDNFCLEDVLEEAKFDIMMFAIDSKLNSGSLINDSEWDMYRKYNPALKGRKFRIDSVKSRIAGLAMWDLVNIHDSEPKESFDELYRNGQLTGYRSVCNRKYGAIKEVNGDYSCRSCAYTEDCFIQLCDYLNNTDKCVKKRAILPISSPRKPPKK